MKDWDGVWDDGSCDETNYEKPDASEAETGKPNKLYLAELEINLYPTSNYGSCYTRKNMKSLWNSWYLSALEIARNEKLSDKERELSLAELREMSDQPGYPFVVGCSRILFFLK